MLLTKTQLKQIIKEEMNKVLLENLVSEVTWAQRTAEKEAAAGSLGKVKQAGHVLTQIRDAIVSLSDNEKLSVMRQVQEINREHKSDPDARLEALAGILNTLKSKR